MKVLVQRSKTSNVSVDNHITGEIKEGLVLLVGFTDGDTLDKIKWMAKKVVNLRIFPDEFDVMNKSILEFGGDILSISQFTLYADTSNGNRPSYAKALKNTEAESLYIQFNSELRNYVKVETGQFGSNMEVHINNMGPTTILLER